MDLSDRARRFIKRLPAGRALWRFGWALDEHGAFRAASAMAFDAFLSGIPLLALTGWAMHRVDPESVLLGSIVRLASGPAAQIADADLLRLSDQAVMTLAPIGVVGFVWLSSSGLATAMGVCEIMFAAQERTWWRRRVTAVSWVIVAVAVLALGAAATLGLIHLIGPAGGVAAALLAAPILVALVVAFFRTAIRRPRGMRRRVLPGALLTVALWALVSLLFTAYVQTVARYSYFYGSLAAVAMLLIWLWLLSMALLVGGELNVQLEGVREFPPSTTGVRSYGR